MNTRSVLTVATITIAAIASASSADILFSDDFENGLGQWTGKNGGPHNGVLVVDPFGSQNTVLSFNGLESGGDMFLANTLRIDPNETYRLSFDYLGLAQEGSRPDDTGGYVGFSVGTPDLHTWHWATGAASNASDVLIDDGQWHSYNFEFTGADLGIGHTVRLMLEDFSGSAGVYGDAYFDNISFGTATVPAPTTAALLGFAGLITARRRRC